MGRLIRWGLDLTLYHTVSSIRISLQFIIAIVVAIVLPRLHN